MCARVCVMRTCVGVAVTVVCVRKCQMCVFILICTLLIEKYELCSAAIMNMPS